MGAPEAIHPPTTLPTSPKSSAVTAPRALLRATRAASRSAAARAAGHPGIPLPPTYGVFLVDDRPDPHGNLRLMGIELSKLLHAEQSFQYHVPVYAGEGVAQALREQAPDVAERLQVVADGDEVVAAGMRVTVHGRQHAVIHEDIPRIVNTAFLVEDEVFHPGDSWTPPPHPVPTLLVPVHAPWMRVAEAVDFARAHAEGTAVAVHDGLLNDDGLAVTERMMGGLLEASGQRYLRVAPGSDL